MSHKTLFSSLSGWMHICLRLGIAAIVLLSANSPVGLAQADGTKTSLAGLQRSVDTFDVPPDAQMHPASVAEDSPMQVPPPPMSVRYPDRNNPPYPPLHDIKRDLYNADRVSVTYQMPDGNRASREAQLGEVYNVGTWMGPGSQDWIWGNAMPDTMVTIEAPGGPFEVYADPACDGCWSLSTSLQPGDEIVVTAGDGVFPVDFSIANPFTAEANSFLDEVSGQIGGWFEADVDVNGTWGEEAFTTTDAFGYYTATFGDIPYGGDGPVHYSYLEDGAQIDSSLWFRAPDLVLDVFTPWNSIEGVYELGHTIILEVYDDLDNLKGSISVPVEEIWGSITGFNTGYHQDLWTPSEPDIVPGDKIYGYVDSAGETPDASVMVGEITGDVDVDTDSITGTIIFPWYYPDPGAVWVECHPWGAPEGADSKWVEVTLDEFGEGSYTCEWDPNSEWDVETDQEIAVSVHDPQNHRIFDVFYEPSYELYMDVNYGHDWIEGWYPPGYEVTFTVYKSDKVTEKASITFMTQEIPWWGGGTGFSTNLEGVYWEPERPDIQAGDWVLGEVVVDTTTYTAEVQLGTITGDINVMDNSITGTIYASWLPQDVEVPIWCDAYSGPGGLESKEDHVLPDGIDTYTCAWDPDTEWDVQAGDDIGVRYGTPDGHSVHNVFKAYTDELILTVQYDHDWIDGNYKPDHTVNLTVYDGNDHVKATISLPTGYIDGWGDTTGFATYQEGAQWVPDHPDIQPGDRVHGEVDDGSQFTADVVIGDVTGEPDVINNSISGTVDAEWLLPGPVDVGCYIWEENAPDNKYDTVTPDGTDTYECSWSGEWDLVPGSNLMVAYFEPAGHQLIGDFSPPAPYLQIQSWFIGDGSPGVGGNAAFSVQYTNQGEAPAENVAITATMLGMTYLRDSSGIIPGGGDMEKTWNLGTVDPGDWIEFILFTEVTADAGGDISNTVEITTSNPYDLGDPSEKISTWEGTVAANDTYLSVDKWTWTWNPAPGEDYVYTINICNNGSTSSSEISVIDTLPPNTTFNGHWWGADAGWQEVGYDEGAHTLALSHTCVSPRTCSEAYIQVTLDPSASPNDDLYNHVVIAADNDLSTGDDEAEVRHNVGDPYMDLSINQSWHWGVLVPGGYYRYGISFRNEGNIGVDVPIEIKATLPPGTSFDGWDSWGAVSVGNPVEAGSEITWTLEEGLAPGFDGTIEVWVTIDPGTLPGTELEHLALIDIQPGESDIDNNTSSLTEMVNGHGPNLRITKNGGVHGYGEGHNLWYNLHLENIGDQAVNDVVVTDTYPDGMELDGGISTNYSEGWSWEDNDPEDQAFSVYLDYVGTGWVIDIDFNVVIPGEDPLEPGVVYENIAEIKPLVGDVNPDDNIASYTMATGPDMYVEKTWETGDFLAGEQVTYVLTFGNMHHDNDWWWNMAGNAILTDEMPEGMSFVSAEMHWCESTEWCEVTPDIDGQTLTWNLYPIGRSNWNEIRLTVEIGDVEQTNPLINEITIGSDQPLVDVDPYLENNFSFYDPGLVVTFSIYLPMILR